MTSPSINRTRVLLVVLSLGVAWTGLSAWMSKRGSFDHEPNFLWLKGSSYGRTIAFAMRGPADLYWHRGSREDLEDHHHDEEHEAEETGPVDVDDPAYRMARLAGDIKREFDEHEAEEAAGPEPRPPAKSVREGLLRWMKDMKIARYERTNDFGDTDAMHSFMKGEAEKRLKLSYEMDPTNLVCYGSYFFFLSESIVRMRGAENQSEVIEDGEQRALALASQTANICLGYRDEPTAMITAASSCHDALTILLRRRLGTEADLRSFHGIATSSLARFDELRAEMVESGLWDQFSEYRQTEMDEARQLLGIALVGDADLIKQRFQSAPGEEL